MIETLDWSGLNLDTRQRMNGLTLLDKIENDVVPLVFFDPQYRGVLDKLDYGNEGERQIERSEMKQMSEEIICEFIEEISRVLQPSGHLMLWVDKFILVEGVSKFLGNTDLEPVDMITWAKLTKHGKHWFGMGYRTRRSSEYLIVLQKIPKRAKGVWTDRGIRDVWEERVPEGHPHAKPIELQKRLIEAVTNPGDVVLDPAAGGYTVMQAAFETDRHFLGCSL